METVKIETLQEGTEFIQESGENSPKPKIVVIMGPTGSGKSKLAIDLASHFPIEIINADSMQVYKGLDVLTNKVNHQEQKGVPHHLLGTISPNVEFTAKDFRDSAIPLIKEIQSRNCLPVIVGGTNYYIQALVTKFLLDEKEVDLQTSPVDKQPHSGNGFAEGEVKGSYTYLKDLDPVAANRIHPNDYRKISQYLRLYTQFGVLPSELLKQRTMEEWGQVDTCRYHCCLICVDASLSVLDHFVEQRVDGMVEAGLLNEIFDIHKRNADYTRGLLQAIGVREFEDFLDSSTDGSEHVCQDPRSEVFTGLSFKEMLQHIMDSSGKNNQKVLLTEAIDRVKLNTRRLVRRQKRRLSRLQMLFGWEIHYLDATESILCRSDDLWAANVVGPSSEIIKSFLNENTCTDKSVHGSIEIKLMQRDLWTQYLCEACGNKVLRGAHEWEQHKQGRSHRKRACRLKY
ncbi:RNA processing factor [Lithospermum erythrorhizon]|uniref:RNA processing factor n=1 Tax=Lithospermum erythrorhizon TaxID=34254 RepID=A0AAV3RM35_LITER